MSSFILLAGLTHVSLFTFDHVAITVNNTYLLHSIVILSRLVQKIPPSDLDSINFTSCNSVFTSLLVLFFLFCFQLYKWHRLHSPSFANQEITDPGLDWIIMKNNTHTPYGDYSLV